MRNFLKVVKKVLEGMKKALEGSRVVLQEVNDNLEGQLMIYGNLWGPLGGPRLELKSILENLKGVWLAFEEVLEAFKGIKTVVKALEEVKDISREEFRDLLGSLDGLCRVWGLLKG